MEVVLWMLAPPEISKPSVLTESVKVYSRFVPGVRVQGPGRERQVSLGNSDSSSLCRYVFPDCRHARLHKEGDDWRHTAKVCSGEATVSKYPFRGLGELMLAGRRSICVNHYNSATEHGTLCGGPQMKTYTQPYP